jgi:hypothetical protein
MNPHLLAVLSRERHREIEADYAHGDESMFRLGVALDERVTAVPAVETRSA